MAIITNKGFCEPGIIKVLLSICTGGGWSSFKLIKMEIVINTKTNKKSSILFNCFIKNAKNTNGMINSLTGYNTTLGLVVLIPMNIR
jgi:hypothetical protein